MAQLALVERQASVLRDGFIPSDKPSICYMCFTQFYRLCTSCPDDSAIARLTSKCAAFLDALARFVMAEDYASEDRRAILSNQLSCNWTQCTECRSHTLSGAQSRRTFIFDDFLDKGCDILATSIRHSASLSSAARPKPFRTKAGSWPQGRDHIFPYGAAACVSNLVTASDICKGAVTLLAIAMIHHRSLLFEEALRHRETIIRHFISVFHHSARILQNLFSLREQREDDDSTFASAIGFTKVYPIFLETIFFGPGALPGDHYKFVLGYEGELYRAIVLLLAYFSNLRAWPGTGQLPEVAGLLYIRLPASARHNPPLFIRNNAHLAASAVAQPYLRLARLLRALTFRQSCFGPDCGRGTQISESYTKFQTCARCKMVRYCSKECQRADWKHDPNPHKEICDILNEACAVADPKISVFEFADACQERQFPLERAQRLFEWIGGMSTTVPTADWQDLPMAYKELLTDTIGAAEKAGLEEEVSEDRVVFDYYIHYVYLGRRS